MASMTTTSGVGQPADLGPDKARQVPEPGSSGTLRVRVPGHLGSLSLAQRSLVSWGRSVLGAQAQQAPPPPPSLLLPGSRQSGRWARRFEQAQTCRRFVLSAAVSVPNG